MKTGIENPGRVRSEQGEPIKADKTKIVLRVFVDTRACEHFANQFSQENDVVRIDIRPVPKDRYLLFIEYRETRHER